MAIVQKDQPSIAIEVIESLEALNEPGMPDLVVELVDIFRTTGPERIAAIQLALAKSELDAIRRAAHAFKSTCHNVGARQLAGACQELEHWAAQQSSPAIKGIDDARGVFEEIRGEYSRACDELVTLAKERHHDLAKPA